MEKILAHIDSHLDAALADLFALMRIPSISAQPDHAPDCRVAAEWARAKLASLGFEARLAETAGLPGVIATHHRAGPGAPHVLFYGHYDVQPADPLELWETPPFAPCLVEGPRGKEIRGRGAVDDKGQVVSFLSAVAAHLAVNGELPVRLTVFLEGEEECGSPSLPALLRAERALLSAAQFVVVADTNMWDAATPAITVSLRGLAAAEVVVRGPMRDLHSGLFGGPAVNPVHELARALGALRDQAGRVQIPGFYDGVKPVPPAVAEGWAALGFDAAAFLAGVGLSTPAGEAGRSVLEQLWARPTAEVNGIWGGYQGTGSKTVIPAQAGAKLTFRLVEGQDPSAILDGFEAFMKAAVQGDAKVEVRKGGRSPGFAVRTDAPFIQAALAAMSEEFGRPAALIGGAASIPVVEAFKRELGLDTVMAGFGLDDDRIHSPNEKFDLACFHRGMRAQARMLAAFGEL